jgi:hypothetical protein
LIGERAHTWRGFGRALAFWAAKVHAFLRRKAAAKAAACNRQIKCMTPLPCIFASLTFHQARLDGPPIEKKGQNPKIQVPIGVKLLTAGGEALTAVDRSVALGYKRNAGGTAALCAHGFEHLAGLARHSTAGLAGIAASLAAGRLILEALFRIEGLFPGGKYELIPTIPANQRLVLVHWIFPL